MKKKLGQTCAVVVAAVAGVLAAIGIASGNDDVHACINTAAGTLREAGDAGNCVRGEVVVNIKAAKAKGGTLTINGVAFKKGSRKTITINGVAFKKGSGKTITINGIPFKKGSRGQTLTINGVAFKRSGKTITINGTEFGPGAAGKQGPSGPPGPPGAAPAGGAPVAKAGPVAAAGGAGAADLIGVDYRNSDRRPHRILVTGGFGAACNPCGGLTKSHWSLAIGAGADLMTRRLPVLDSNYSEAGASVSEIVVTPSVCAPCTVNLRLTATAGAAGASTLDASDIRLGVVDLGAG